MDRSTAHTHGIDLNAFGLDQYDMHHVRRQTRGAFSSAGHYVRHYIGKLAGYKDMGVDEARMRQLSFASTAGFADGQLFLDSCCSRTIIHDAKLLTNIRPLAVAKHIMGIGGFKRIKHVGDLNMRMTDVTGKAQTVVVRNVYYEPTLTYNLVSVADMMRSQYTSTFSPSGSTLEGPAGKFALTRTSDVYALPVDNVDKTCEMGTMGRTDGGGACALAFQPLHQHAQTCDPLQLWRTRHRQGSEGRVLEMSDMPAREHQTLARGTRRHWFRPIRYELRSHRHDIYPHNGGMRYCTIFLVRKTRFAYTFLHEKKDEFPTILDKLMARFDPARDLKF